MIKLADIVCYPVKGTRGLHHAEAVVERRGLQGDRRWMLIDAQERFLTQRTLPRLALLRATPGEGYLLLEAPGERPLEVPVPGGDAPRASVMIWDDTVTASVAHETAAAWCSAWLGREVRLVYMDDDTVRPVDPAYAKEDDRVGFADGFPVLLTGTASLDDLNARLAEPIPMDRFRPNLVVTGCGSFEEDTWAEIQVGDVTFYVVKPCKRCVVTTIDQATAEAGVEPLRTLATFRKEGGGVLFGQNLIPAAPGTVRVGDPVTVVRRR